MAGYTVIYFDPVPKPFGLQKAKRFKDKSSAVRFAKALPEHWTVADVYRRDPRTRTFKKVETVRATRNPMRKHSTSAIPLKWTPAKVRRNAKGQVQVALGRRHAAR
jgi:hypothetical protein